MTGRELVILAAIGLGGCVNLNVESSEDYTRTVKTAKDVSVSTRTFDGIQARLVRTDRNSGRFSLVCRGAFEIEQERKVENRRSGNHALTVGFCPGFFALSEGTDGTSYSKWPGLGLMVLVMNAGLCGFPTLVSLFYEPFGGYHDSNSGQMSRLATQGLVGCCKWRRWKNWARNTEEHGRDSFCLSEYALTDYEVSISGVRHSCTSPAKEIPVDIPPGKTVISVRIERVPSMSGDLGRFVGSLEGLDLEVEVP